MTACFADAFYFLAMLNPRDQAHPAVTAINTTLRRPLVTTIWVLSEVADALAATPHRGLFATLLSRLRSNPSMTIVAATDALFDEGVALFDGRSDKRWSLTDCISFVVMHREGITDALTGDHHFEQAGFIAMLK